MIGHIVSAIACFLWVKTFGLEKGFAVILSLYVHEMGHYIVAKEYGLNPQTPIFIPYLGAFVRHDITSDTNERFYVAFAGPAFGGIFGVIFYGIFLYTNNSFTYYLALTSFFLNLLNLLPISILDGGQMINALDFRGFQLWLTFLGLKIAIDYSSIFFIVLASIGIILHFIPKEETTPMTKDERVGYLALYLFAVVVLAVLCFAIVQNPLLKTAL